MNCLCLYDVYTVKRICVISKQFDYWEERLRILETPIIQLTLSYIEAKCLSNFTKSC